MTPTIGRIVLYMLTLKDAEQINRRRTTGESVRDRMNSLPQWPTGAMAHIGTEVSVGMVFPMVIVRVPPQEGAGTRVNGKVLLDGTDELWVRDVIEGDHAGTWAWPARS